MSRTEMLAKLRGLLDEAAPLPSETPAFPIFDDPVATFRLEAERVGVRVIDGRPLPETLSKILAEQGASRLYWQGVETLRSNGIEHRPSPGTDVSGLLYSEHPESRVDFPLELRVEEYTRDAVARAQVSVGNALHGVAETGTIVETTASGWGRALPILPPCHVVLLSKRHLLMNQAELFRTFDLKSGGSARLLMTGPSRTADIEKTLILGVHGPGTLYVVLLPWQAERGGEKAAVD